MDRKCNSRTYGKEHQQKNRIVTNGSNNWQRTTKKKLDEILKNRKENGKYFDELFSKLNNVSIQKNIDDSSYFGFSLIFKDERERKRCIELFNKNNIECRPIVAGNFTKNKVIEYYDYTIHDDLKNSDIIHSNGLFIGNHHFDVKPKIHEIYELIKGL